MSDLHTIGHSQHPPAAFFALLARHAIDLLVDVRAAPYSRRHPQFNRETLAASLEQHGIRYRWLGRSLGGLREATGPTPHTALTVPAFQAYAAHLADAACRDALHELADVAATRRVVVMCAEADPAHCHRQFIADALCVDGHAVWHIAANGEAQAHRLHAALRVVDGQLVYDRHRQGALF